MPTMTDIEIVRHARHAVDELRAGRHTRLPAMTEATAARVVAAVRRLLTGDDPLADTPD
jgi:hypothetical protein